MTSTSTHRSESTLDWLSVSNIKTLDLLAKSLDLNSIENLWGIFARQVYDKRKQSGSIVELKVNFLPNIQFRIQNPGQI